MILGLLACHPRVDLMSLPVAPRAVLSCGPCDTGGSKMVAVSIVPLHPEDLPDDSSQIELGHGVTATCRGEPGNFSVFATVSEAQIAAEPRLPLDLVGRCALGERDYVFVVTLQRDQSPE